MTRASKSINILERGSLKDAVIWKDSLYITLASAFVKVALKTGEIDTINRIRSEKLFPLESCLFVNTAKSIVIYRDNYDADTLLNVSAKKVIETDDNCFLILTNGDNYIHYNCLDNKKRVVKHYGLPVFTDIYWKNGKVYGCNKSGIYQCSFQESELKILQKYTLENTYLTLKDADTKRTYIATDQFVQVIDLEHLFAQPEKLKVHKLYIHKWTGSRVGQTFRLDKTQNSFDFLIGDNHAASLRYLVVNNEDSVYYNTNNISLGYLKEGLSKFQVVGFDRFGNPSEPFEIKVSNLLPLAYSTRFLFGVLAVIMLVLFTTIYFYQRNNIRFIKLKSRNNEEEMRHKLVALSSQMKPHFIHNILNTAQYYMITEDIDRSNLVIAKLSAIIDEVLTATTQRDTTIEKVVDFLEQYCSLEQIRFENKFDYCIEVDQEVNVNQPIPYFFIQPLVENAIWHGLLKDNDNKNRQVRVHIKRAMDAIEVTVEDNGLGYKNAGDAHTSISIRNLNERINLLRKLNEWDIKLRIDQASSFERGTLCTVHFSRIK
jgi:two-component sensor histidine kinase